MELIKFLRSEGLERLSDKFTIAINRHKIYQNLVQLKYSQIDSPMSSKIVQQCRGIILDEDKDWAIVSYPFDKFFNYGEPNAVAIDWNTASAFEKLDGSLMTLYYYNQQWQVASSALPDASAKVRHQNYTLADLFWSIWDEKHYDLPKDHQYCYMFEMLHPSIRVLVPYEKGHLKLIGIRDLHNLREVHIEHVKNKEWEKARQFDFKTQDGLIARSEALNPIEQEGFVLCDKDFNRVKVKSPQYVKINLLKGANKKLTDRYLLDIIRINEGDEFLSYFEDYRTRYNELKVKYKNLLKKLEDKYEKVKHIEDKKELGLQTKDSPFPSLFFQLNLGKITSVKEYLRKMNIKNLLEKLT